ncbi:MAG: mechanosensitive ion channel family protein [Bacteroidia bacterium]|nr:mechanosensitive ion channel family protein [Bacteroidia bacterium]NND25455.1 mechanosensitive ion channel family protein [Flavobacteriaceae bacterium]MBT8278951.1 mechanosensitive ion channel family protein [Bacteroidia bacterium]NNK60625.1 mechanosensitive ion channel family protein [Flavobacteriaceae bacterium]NNL32175.1 mechanosensitive ion channel family protein [Flavobacteriaceae bacterium]
MKTQFETALEALIDKLEGWFTAIVTNLPNIILAVIVMFSAFFLAKFTNKYIYKLVSKKVDQESISNIISKVASVAIVIVALFLSLGILNLDQALTSILTGAGITGLVIGLALQGTLSNTISGIILSFRKKIQIGNWVETSGYSGEVMDINLKGFILKEADNNLVIIPNKTIIENPIKNYSLTTRMRVTIECGVGYESDLEKVKDLTKSTIANNFKQIDGPEEVEFFYTEYGGSSINFICRFWIDAENSKEKLMAKSKAIIEIKKAFDAENINIPFPIRTLQFDNKLSFNVPQKLEESISKN